MSHTSYDRGTTWSAPAGELKTQRKVMAQFILPELQDKQLIEWNLHAAEDMGVHDMTIGRERLSFLRIDIKFSEQFVCWDESKMPFKPCDVTPETHCHTEEAMAASGATKRIKDILDAKCKAADLEKGVLSSLTLRCNNGRGHATHSRSTKTCSMEPWASGNMIQWTLSSRQMPSYTMLDPIPSLSVAATLSGRKWIA